MIINSTTLQDVDDEPTELRDVELLLSTDVVLEEESTCPVCRDVDAHCFEYGVKVSARYSSPRSPVAHQFPDQFYYFRSFTCGVFVVVPYSSVHNGHWLATVKNGIYVAVWPETMFSIS